MAISAASSTAMPARMRRGLSRNGRRTGGRGGRTGPGPGDRRGAMDVTVAGMAGYGMNVNFALPSTALAIPGHDEPVASRPRERAHADVVLAIGLERRRGRHRHAVEPRHPLADRVLILCRTRVLDAAVYRARHLVAAREIVEADARRDRDRGDRAIEERAAPPQFDLVGKRRRQAALNRIADIGRQPVAQLEGHKDLSVTRERSDFQIRTVGPHATEPASISAIRAATNVLRCLRTVTSLAYSLAFRDL